MTRRPGRSGGWLTVALAVAASLAVSTCGDASPTTQPSPSASTSSPAPASVAPTADAETAPPGTTPEPTASQASPNSTASAAPTPTQSEDGWPVAVADSNQGGLPAIDADGTAYAWIPGADGNSLVAAFDAGGRMRPGWPVDVAPGSHLRSVGVLSDGSVLIGVTETVAGNDYRLHRLGRDGRERPGWPVGADWPVGPMVPWCAAGPEGPDGTLYVGCALADGGPTLVVALQPDGRVVPGWPVALEHVILASAWGETIQVSPDGTVFVLTNPATSMGRAILYALAPDGHVQPGWPVVLGAARGGYRVVPGGRILVGTYLPPAKPVGGLCSEARATVFTELDGRGRVVAGWPQRAVGFASVPAIAPDGTVYYLTRDRLIARSPDGSLRDGWPVRIADTYSECGSSGPYLGPDGTVYAFADGLRAFTPGGRPKPGWPFRPPGAFTALPCMADVSTGPAPAFGADGAVYVATAAVSASGSFGPGEVTAVDQRGRVVPGWPYVVYPEDHSGVIAMTYSNGHLYVTAADCRTGSRLLALAPDGTLAR